MQEQAQKLYTRINNLTDKVSVTKDMLESFNNLEVSEQQEIFDAILGARSRRFFQYRMDFLLHPAINWDISQSHEVRKKIINAFTFSQIHAKYIAQTLLNKIDLNLTLNQAQQFMQASLAHSDEVVSLAYQAVRKNHSLDDYITLLNQLPKRAVVPFYQELNLLANEKQIQYIQKLKTTSAKNHTVLDCVLMTNPTQEIFKKYLAAFPIQRHHVLHIMCTALKDSNIKTIHMIDDLFNYQDLFNREFHITTCMSKKSATVSQLRGVNAELKPQVFEFLMNLTLCERVKNYLVLGSVYTKSLNMIDSILEKSPSSELLAFLLMNKEGSSKQEEKDKILEYLKYQPKKEVENFIALLKSPPEKFQLPLISENRSIKIRPEYLDLCERVLLYSRLQYDLPQSANRSKNKI